MYMTCSTVLLNHSYVLSGSCMKPNNFHPKCWRKCRKSPTMKTHLGTDCASLLLPVLKLFLMMRSWQTCLRRVSSLLDALLSAELNESELSQRCMLHQCENSAAYLGQGRAATCRGGSAAAGFSQHMKKLALAISCCTETLFIVCSSAELGKALHELFSPVHSHSVYLELRSETAQYHLPNF